MASVLWVDDDADSFPLVEKTIADLGARVHPCFTIASALEWIRKNRIPSCMLLDAIVPLGDPDLQAGLGDEFAHYTGRIILREYPDLQKKTVVLSIVRSEIIRKVFHALGIADQEPDNCRVFSKLELSGEKLKRFRNTMKSLLGQESI